MDLFHDSGTYHIEVGHRLLLAPAVGQYPPGNDVVKVQFVRYVVVHPYSFRRGEVHPVFHRPDLWGARMAQVEVPIHELGYIHRMPLNSRTVVVIKRVMGQLGVPRDVELLMLRNLRLESLLVRARRLSSPSPGQIVFTVDVISDTLVLVANNGQDEKEEDGEEEGIEVEDYMINKLKKLVIDEGTMIDEMCTVCLDDIESENQLARLPCNHVYHQPCIMKWLSVSRTCPICHYQLASVCPVSNIS